MSEYDIDDALNELAQLDSMPLSIQQSANITKRVGDLLIKMNARERSRWTMALENQGVSPITELEVELRYIKSKLNRVNDLAIIMANVVAGLFPDDNQFENEEEFNLRLRELGLGHITTFIAWIRGSRGVSFD